MRVIKSAAEMRDLAHTGQRAAVFTMGALHAGHAELIRVAKTKVGAAGEAVVSIFVNPTQFNDPTDLAKYPSTPTADLELCVAAGADVVFMPSVDEIYPAPAHSAGQLGEIFEGASRPGHFDGVATVVARLLELTNPDFTFFGEKDFQQLVVVRRLVQEMKLPVEVIGVPTVRAADGLALSSRNQRLSQAGREMAAEIYRAMLKTRAELLNSNSVDQALQAGLEVLQKTDELMVDYFGLVDENLQSIDGASSLEIGVPARILTAVYLEGVRLIDNLAVER